MTSETLYEILGELSDAKIREAARKTRPAALRNWAAAAACLCLAVGLAAVMALRPPADTPQDALSPASFTLSGVTYMISSHLSVTDTLPEGFTHAGTVSTGGFENCPIYTHPDIPEWVYVYQEVLTDGTVDATGTLHRTPPRHAYVRYVDARLRGRDLICRDGVYYISMWSAESYGSAPDVTPAYYDEMRQRYGTRLEGAVPDGFIPAGTAVFTGEDTVPTGALASNKGGMAIYYHPEDPSVLLAQTHWFTATAEENGQTRHDGWNVYIRYDCPFRPLPDAGA